MLVYYVPQLLKNNPSSTFEAVSSALTTLLLAKATAETVSELTYRICDRYFPEPTLG